MSFDDDDPFKGIKGEARVKAIVDAAVAAHPMYQEGDEMVCACGQRFPLDLSGWWEEIFASRLKIQAGHWDSIANGALMYGDPI